MVKLIIPLSLLVVFVSCQKKMNNDLLSDSQQLTDIRSSNSIANPVIIAQAPPASISGDLTVDKPDGTVITLITEADYNALAPADQVYYTGLRNSMQYLFQDPVTQSSTLRFNADGSYAVAVNTVATDDDPSSSEQSCTACNATSSLGCIVQIYYYMKAHGFKTILVKVEKKPGCLKITYKAYQIFEPVPGGGTVVETYNPPPPPTYSASDFDPYISAVKNWFASNQGSGPSGGGPLSNPLFWSRQDLIDHIRAFNNNSSHPVLAHQHDANFQTQLEYYINNVMTDDVVINP